MAIVKGVKQPIFLGDIFIGELMTWPNQPGVRFFYRASAESTLYMSMADDFETRHAFDIWLAASIKGSVKSLAEV